MPETVLERHYRDRVHSVSEMALHEAVETARSLQDFEDLVALCSELSVSGRELLEKEYQRVFREPNLSVAWLRERRRAIEELTNNYLRLAEAIRAQAFQAWQAAGSPPENDLASGLESAMQAVAVAKQRVLACWPVGSDQEIADARAAATRGEGLDVDEAFAQVAGVDVATWRQRVESATSLQSGKDGG